MPDDPKDPFIPDEYAGPELDVTEYESEGAPLAGVPRVSLTMLYRELVAGGRGGVLYPEAHWGGGPPPVRGVIRPDPFCWDGELSSGVSWECSPVKVLTDALVVYVYDPR